MSWLHDHREQLDGYQLYAEIAYRFRPKVLPDDRDDIEMEIVLKLKAEADKKPGNARLPVCCCQECSENLLAKEIPGAEEVLSPLRG